MSFISETQLKNYRRSTKSYSLTLNESLKNFRSESSYYKTKVFLSHKHDELESLEGAISFLKNFGVDIYVDWQDEGMPKTTSGYTAVRIKQKIKDNHKFILIATEGAINSKWCNWELGLGDAAKYIEHIALFPINKTSQSFSGAEYLKIYPYIEYENGNGKYLSGSSISSGYYVKTPLDNGNLRLTPLKEWLKR